MAYRAWALKTKGSCNRNLCATVVCPTLPAEAWSWAQYSSACNMILYRYRFVQGISLATEHDATNHLGTYMLMYAFLYTCAVCRGKTPELNCLRKRLRSRCALRTC